MAEGSESITSHRTTKKDQVGQEFGKASRGKSDEDNKTGTANTKEVRWQVKTVTGKDKIAISPDGNSGDRTVGGARM